MKQAEDRGRALTAAFLAMLALRSIGAATSPALLAHAPLVLIALSPMPHHLVITAPLAPPWAWFTVALIISIAQCSLGYAFGRSRGPSAVQWLVGKRLVGADRAQRVLDAFDRAAPAVLIVLPGPVVSSLGGVAGVSRRRFAVPMVTAQLLWLGACYLLGEALTQWIADVQAVALEHAFVLTLLFVLIAAYRVRGLRGAG